MWAETRREGKENLAKVKLAENKISKIKTVAKTHQQPGQWNQHLPALIYIEISYRKHLLGAIWVWNSTFTDYITTYCVEASQLWPTARAPKITCLLYCGHPWVGSNPELARLWTWWSSWHSKVLFFYTKYNDQTCPPPPSAETKCRLG